MNYQKVVEALEDMFKRGIKSGEDQIKKINPIWERQLGFAEGRTQEMKDSLEYLQEMKKIWIS